MLKIRLQRAGKKKKPFYKIVVAESLSKRDGKHLEAIGYYDPILKNSSLNVEQFLKYLRRGAQPTKKVYFLTLKFVSSKIKNSILS